MCTTQDYYTVEVTEPITTDAGTYRIRVVSDPHVPNPRKDYDQLGTWVSWERRRHDLPNEVDNDPRVTDRVAEAYEHHHYYGAAYAVRYLTTVCGAVALPVYGDERTSAGKLDERIDGGARITGVIYVRRADIATQWAGYDPMPSDAEIAEWLAAEVDQYATWANGEMVSYTIERLTCGHWDCDDNDHWEDVTSGGGSYFSIDEALDVARADIPTEPVHGPKRQCVGCTEFEGGRDFPGHVHQWAGTEDHLVSNDLVELIDLLGEYGTAKFSVAWSPESAAQQLGDGKATRLAELLARLDVERS